MPWWLMVPALVSVPLSVTPAVIVRKPVVAWLVSVPGPAMVPPDQVNRPLGKLNVALAAPTASVPLLSRIVPVPEPAYVPVKVEVLVPGGSMAPGLVAVYVQPVFVASAPGVRVTF